MGTKTRRSRPKDRLSQHECKKTAIVRPLFRNNFQKSYFGGGVVVPPEFFLLFFVPPFFPLFFLPSLVLPLSVVVVPDCPAVLVWPAPPVRAKERLAPISRANAMVSNFFMQSPS